MRFNGREWLTQPFPGMLNEYVYLDPEHSQFPLLFTDLPKVVYEVDYEPQNREQPAEMVALIYSHFKI